MTKYRISYRMSKSSTQVVRSLWANKAAYEDLYKRLVANGRVIVSVESK